MGWGGGTFQKVILRHCTNKVGYWLKEYWSFSYVTFFLKL